MFPSALRPEYKHLIGITHTEERDGRRFHHLNMRFVRSGFQSMHGLPTQTVLDDILYHNAKAIVPIPVYNNGNFPPAQDFQGKDACFNYFFISTDYTPPLMILKRVDQFFDDPYHTPFLSVWPNEPNEPTILIEEETLLHNEPFIDAVVSGMVKQYQQKSSGQRIGSSHLFL